MSLAESAAAAAAALDDAGPPPPPEIRVDDEDGAVKLQPSSTAAADDGSPGAERRRSMPVGHGRCFVDEPYVFSLSQSLALSGRRRSEPLTPDATETPRDGQGSGGGSSPRRRVFVAAAADTADSGERRGSVGSGAATPKTSPTAAALPSLDELSRLHLVASSSVTADSDDDPAAGATAGSRFLALPQTSDYLAVPARRHSVALVQPISSRLLDVIAEETVAADAAKALASSRRYSLSCQLNT